MKKLLPYVCLAALGLSGCRELYTHTATRYHEVAEGKVLITNPDLHLSMTFFGDYTFHQPVKDSMLFSESCILKSLKPERSMKPVVLFCGHTTISPFCSTIGVQYQNVNADTCLQRSLRYFRTEGTIYNLTVSDSVYAEGAPAFTRAVFRYFSKQHKVMYNLCDYYYSKGNRTYRFLFWTLGNTSEWFAHETGEITGSLITD